MVAGENDGALRFITFIGTFTAFFAATIAVAQNDIKKVLAYSTISQLGFMFAALGVLGYVAAAFHLLIHAFFKALLFLGSGSVIHGMEHGHHEAAEHAGHAFDPQDMRNMGGLFRRMPRTAWTFIIGGLALSGLPFITAGFWSKDEILAEAFHGSHPVVFAVLVVTALLTAFYTARQIMMTFFGKPRTSAAEHASEHDSVFTWMTVPLIVLAVFAIAGGWVGIPTTFPLLGVLSSNPFHHVMAAMAEVIGAPAEELPFSAVPLLASIIASVGGLALGWAVYRAYAAGSYAPGLSPLERPDPLERRLGRVYVWLQRKYGIDELYHRVFVLTSLRLSNWLFRFDDVLVIDPIVDGAGHVGRRLSDLSRWVDTRLVDAAVNGVGAVIGVLGGQVRRIQTGKVQNYLLVVLVTLSVLLFAFLLMPK
jgi:NADH-quinone oxidoreductase subunit L